MKKFKHVDPKHQSQAFSEASILNRLSHEHIIQYVDVFLADGLLHLVLELATGGDLAQCIHFQKTSGKYWSTTFIKECFVQVLSGITFLHRSNVMHRDLKPSNLLLKEKFDGKVPIIKLADFGLSKVMGGSQGTAAQARTRCGTPVYMAPEALDSDTDSGYSYKNDVWALGCILYELCMFKRAFHKQSNIFFGLIPKIDETSYDGQDWKELSFLCSKILTRDVETRPSSSVLCEILHVSAEAASLSQDNQWVQGVQPADFTILDNANNTSEADRRIAPTNTQEQSSSSSIWSTSTKSLQPGDVIELFGHRIPEMNGLEATIQSKVASGQEKWTVKLHAGKRVERLFRSHPAMEDLIDTEDLITVVQRKHFKKIMDKATAEKERRQQEILQKKEDDMKRKNEELQQEIRKKKLIEYEQDQQSKLQDKQQESLEAEKLQDTVLARKKAMFLEHQRVESILQRKIANGELEKMQFSKVHKKYNDVLKLIFLGNSGTGKTSIRDRIVKPGSQVSSSRTAIESMDLKIAIGDDTIVMLDVCDGGGLELYSSMMKWYYNGANVCLFVYDVSDLSSLDALEHWNIDFMKHGPLDPLKILIGNKADVENRKVSFEEGQYFAKQLGMEFVEVSAVTHFNLMNLLDIVKSRLQQQSSCKEASSSTEQQKALPPTEQQEVVQKNPPPKSNVRSIFTGLNKVVKGVSSEQDKDDESSTAQEINIDDGYFLAGGMKATFDKDLMDKASRAFKQNEIQGVPGGGWRGGGGVGFKCTTVGNLFTGKTQVMNRIMDKPFSHEPDPHSRVYGNRKYFMLNDKDVVCLSLNDHTGSYCFGTAMAMYFGGSDIIFYFYDVTCKHSFDMIPKHAEFAQGYAERDGSRGTEIHTVDDMFHILVGNKVDRKFRREVSYEEGQTYARQNQMHFFEVSAKTKENIDEMMQAIVRLILPKAKERLKRKKVRQSYENNIFQIESVV